MAEDIQSFSAMLRQALGDRIAADASTFLEMMAEDGVMEFPFAPVGLPNRAEGRKAIAAHLKSLGGLIAFDRIGEAVVHTTADADVVILEFNASGHGIETGAAYKQRYVSIIRTRDGRIVHYRDYWNPLAVLGAVKGSDISKVVTIDEYARG